MGTDESLRPVLLALFVLLRAALSYTRILQRGGASKNFKTGRLTVRLLVHLLRWWKVPVGQRVFMYCAYLRRLHQLDAAYSRRHGHGVSGNNELAEPPHWRRG